MCASSLTWCHNFMRWKFYSGISWGSENKLAKCHRQSVFFFFPKQKLISKTNPWPTHRVSTFLIFIGLRMKWNRCCSFLNSVIIRKNKLITNSLPLIGSVALHGLGHCMLCLWIDWMSHWVVERNEFEDVVWVYMGLDQCLNIGRMNSDSCGWCACIWL